MTTSLLAATTGTDPPGWLALAGLLWIGWRILPCWLYPYAPCHSCAGTGKRRSPSGRNWRPCSRCGGKGSKTRLGRRLWNASGTAAHRDR